jgi:uncharacterized SAM-binding protein YcdF (DUF218 family)
MIHYTPSYSKTNNIAPLVVLWGVTKSRVLAAIEYLRKNPEIKTIVFSWGKTSGSKLPSEAENMQEYFISKYPEFIKYGWQILVEKEACDTEDNAEKTIRLLQKDIKWEISGILLLTDTTHVLRAWWAFERRGVNVSRITTESLLSKRSRHHVRYLQKLILSPAFLKQSLILEPLLHALTLLQTGRDFIRSKTQTRIQG